MHNISNRPVTADSTDRRKPLVRISQLILLCVFTIIIGMRWASTVVAQDNEPIPVNVEIAIETEDGEIVTASLGLQVSPDGVVVAGIEPSNGVTVTASVLKVQQAQNPTARPQVTETPKPTVASSFSGAAAIVALDGPLKSEPNNGSSVVDTVSNGDQVIVVGQDARGSWFLLNDGSWVASDMVGNLGVEVPVVGSGDESVTVEEPANTPEATSTPTPTNTPKPTSIPTKTATPLPDSATIIGEIVKQHMGTSNRDIEPPYTVELIEQFDGGYSIHVNWAISDNLFESWIKRGAQDDIVRVLKNLQASDIDDYKEIVFFGTFELVDQLGNSSEANVVKMVYAQEKVNAINFERFLAQDVFEVADTGTLHPAFQD